MNRRTFISTMLAAPVIVQASTIWVPPRRLVRPEEFVVTIFEDSKGHIIGVTGFDRMRDHVLRYGKPVNVRYDVIGYTDD